MPYCAMHTVCWCPGGLFWARILGDNSRTGFEGKVGVSEGWSVSGSFTDNPDRAKFVGKDGLSLSGNSGILLIVEKK